MFPHSHGIEKYKERKYVRNGKIDRKSGNENNSDNVVRLERIFLY